MIEFFFTVPFKEQCNKVEAWKIWKTMFSYVFGEHPLYKSGRWIDLNDPRSKFLRDTHSLSIRVGVARAVGFWSPVLPEPSIRYSFSRDPFRAMRVNGGHNWIIIGTAWKTAQSHPGPSNERNQRYAPTLQRGFKIATAIFR